MRFRVDFGDDDKADGVWVPVDETKTTRYILRGSLSLAAKFEFDGQKISTQGGTLQTTGSIEDAQFADGTVLLVNDRQVVRVDGHWQDRHMTAGGAHSKPPVREADRLAAMEAAQGEIEKLTERTRFLQRLVQELQVENESLKAEKRALIEHTRSVETRLAEVAAGQADPITTETAPAKKATVEATVIDTREIGETVIVAIDKGTSQGVVEGMEFLIAHDGKFMGVLRISEVSASGAAGHLTLRQGKIARGMTAVPKQ